VPPADPSDAAQVALLRRGIREPAVRGPVLAAMASLAGANASHNFDVVLVGGRWRRLNYADLGPRYVDARFMGVLLRLLEFDDLATSGIAATWGRFGALGPRTRDFTGPNPYRLVDVTDRLGVHAKRRVALDDGGAEPGEHAALTIVGVEWKRDPGAPGRLLVDQGAHVLLCRVAEWFDEQGPDQYRRFTQRADLAFDVVTEDGRQFRATCRVGYEVDPEQGLHGVWLAVPVEAAARMPRGSPLRLVPRNAAAGATWKVELPAPFEKP
jgi:hypothetical protein